MQRVLDLGISCTVYECELGDWEQPGSVMVQSMEGDVWTWHDVTKQHAMCAGRDMDLTAQWSYKDNRFNKGSRADDYRYSKYPMLHSRCSDMGIGIFRRPNPTLEWHAVACVLALGQSSSSPNCGLLERAN